MKTTIRTHGDTIFVCVTGRLNHEEQEPLMENLNRIVHESKNDSTPRKFIFNLENLEFVGSSGISSFVHTLKMFNESVPTRPRYCGVQSEFQKIIRAFDETDGFDFFDSEEGARRSFEN